MAWLSYVVPAVITPISEGYKRVIVSKYGISPGKVHVIEVGVETLNLRAPVNLSKVVLRFCTPAF